MRLILCAAIVGLAVGGSVPARAALSEDTFQVRDTGDLVALCSADRADPLYTPAQNFCHGFAVGTYRTLADVERGMRAKRKLFCPPAIPPSRNEGISQFVQWAGAHPDAMRLPATDGVLEFLTEQFPCK